MWCRIEDNAIYAALHAALHDSVPRDLADRLLAPFSWPDPPAIEASLDAAGFCEIRVRRAALPLIFESGIAQAARALSASPLASSLAALPAAARDALNAAISARLAPLLSDGKVSADMTSNIAVAHVWAKRRSTWCSLPARTPTGDVGFFDLDPCNLHDGEAGIVADQLVVILAHGLAGEISTTRLADRRSARFERMLAWPD